MKFTPERLAQWRQAMATQNKTYIDPTINTVRPPQGSSFSLLSHIKYTPSQRDQGYCGNCWAWAGTALIEVALDVNHINYDRESVQYLNSYYNGGTGSNWACCGGWPSDVASFYGDSSTGRGIAIPWANTNAAWADGGQSCSDSTTVSASSISENPAYPIRSISATTITTLGVGTTQAIANIKNVLTQNKAVDLGFFLPTYNSWYGSGPPEGFIYSWNHDTESYIFNYDNWSGLTWDPYNGGGHATVIVGWNDVDSNPANWYWIVLNSWGDGANRPNGLFHVAMNMNYDDYYVDGGVNYAMMDFETLDILFNPVFMVVRGGSGAIYYRENLAQSGGFTALPGSTPSPPAAAISGYAGGRLHIAIRGNSGAVYYGYLTYPGHSFSGWTAVGGSTPSSPAIAADSGNNVWLAVRGNSNQIYLNYRPNGGAWHGWWAIPGSTSDSPAISFSGAHVYIAIRGMSGGHIFWGRITAASPFTFSGFTAVPGSTTSRPSIAAQSDSIVFLAVRGSSGNVYLSHTTNGGSTWSAFSLVPGGTTPDPPSITSSILVNSISHEILYVAIRGNSGGTIWTTMARTTSGAVGTFYAYTSVPGSTPSPPAIAGW